MFALMSAVIFFTGLPAAAALMLGTSAPARASNSIRIGEPRGPLSAAAVTAGPVRESRSRCSATTCCNNDAILQIRAALSHIGRATAAVSRRRNCLSTVTAPVEATKSTRSRTADKDVKHFARYYLKCRPCEPATGTDYAGASTTRASRCNCDFRYGGWHNKGLH